MSKICVVLFSDDFRIEDNEALYFASLNYESIILLYIYNEEYLGRKIGKNAKIFLFNVLKNFKTLLKKEYNQDLLIRKGLTIEQLIKLKKEVDFSAIFFNKSYLKSQIEVEKEIRTEFSNLNIKSFNGKMLFTPELITTKENTYFRVFTPFSKECFRNIDKIGKIVPRPENLGKNILIEKNLYNLNLEDLNLNESSDLDINYWTFNYKEIYDNFDNFLNHKILNYEESRNIPSLNGNSNISPYLRFGIISVRYCFNKALNLKLENSRQFLLELLWREFAYYVSYRNANMKDLELKQIFRKFKWDYSSKTLENFEAWKVGKTGFNLVDAGMREIAKTGFMHNRVRMVVASYLIKDLFIDWKFGEEYFWQYLVDADGAINPFSWQWVFGSGMDAAPYFRIFNPDSQLERFDKDLKYCKRWLSYEDLNRDKISNHSLTRVIAMQKYKEIAGILE